MTRGKEKKTEHEEDVKRHRCGKECRLP